MARRVVLIKHEDGSDGSTRGQKTLKQDLTHCSAARADALEELPDRQGGQAADDAGDIARQG